MANGINVRELIRFKWLIDHTSTVIFRMAILITIGKASSSTIIEKRTIHQKLMVLITKTVLYTEMR